MTKKALVAYVNSFTSDILEHFAKFDLVATRFEAGDVSEVHGLNPETKILGYLNAIGIKPDHPAYGEVTIHEDWFVHDLNGNRLVRKGFGWELLDISKPEVRSALASYVQRFRDKGFDGVMLDDVWHWSDWHTNNAFTVGKELIPPALPTFFDNALKGHIQYLKSKMPGYLLILNANVRGIYEQYADGVVIEAFARPGLEIARVNEEVAAKKVICYVSPLAEYSVSSLYGFGCYLLGYHENAYFAYHRIEHEHKGYPPEMDEVHGKPCGSYFKVENGVYARNFEKLQVTVDTNTQTATIQATEGCPDGNDHCLISFLLPLAPIPTAVASTFLSNLRCLRNKLSPQFATDKYHQVCKGVINCLEK